jgi:hypothetical protein
MSCGRVFDVRFTSSSWPFSSSSSRLELASSAYAGVSARGRAITNSSCCAHWVWTGVRIRAMSTALAVMTRAGTRAGLPNLSFQGESVAVTPIPVVLGELWRLVGLALWSGSAIVLLWVFAGVCSRLLASSGEGRAVRGDSRGVSGGRHRGRVGRAREVAAARPRACPAVPGGGGAPAEQGYDQMSGRLRERTTASAAAPYAHVSEGMGGAEPAPVAGPEGFDG